MLAKRYKYNLSIPENREKLRSFDRYYSPPFIIRSSHQPAPQYMVVVGKGVSNSAVQRNALKRVCYEVLEKRRTQGDSQSYVIYIRRKIENKLLKEQLLSFLAQSK